MIEVGRVCLKIAGRDANQKCVIIDVIDNNYVLIDGQTRRKKCNINHLEPLSQIVSVSQNATHNEVVSALQGLGVVCLLKKGPKANKTKKPVQKRRSNLKRKIVKTKVEKSEKKVAEKKE